MYIPIEEKQHVISSWWPWLMRYGALIWSVIYGGITLCWLLGVPGYPFADKGNMDFLAALITALPAGYGKIILVALCFLGILLQCLNLSPWRRSLPGWVTPLISWSIAAALLFLPLDIMLIAMIAYAFLLHFTFSWLLLNQFICIIGALLWVGYAVHMAREARQACLHCGRSEGQRESWIVRHHTWLVAIAVIAPLPYAFSRWAWALGFPLGIAEEKLAEFHQINPSANTTEWVFGAICIIGSLLTLGLRMRWGEVFPRWLPLLGGKRVPVLLAVIPASLVAIGVTVAGFIFGITYTQFLLHLIPASIDSLVATQMHGAIGPMITWFPWGISLALATAGYALRRRGRCTVCGQE